MTLTAEQIEARRSGIGGSEAAAVCGLSRWRSPMDVYLDKIGALPETDETEAMYWGTKLEAAIGARFAEEHPEYVVKLQPHSTPQAGAHPFMLGLPDGLLYADDGSGLSSAAAGLEVKTANAFKRDEWEDTGVPIEYLLQCQHYMAVFDLPVWHVAVLIGGQTYLERTIERDDELIAMLVERESSFWKLVEDRTPPAIDGSKASSNVLSVLYPADAVIEPPADIPEEVDFDGSPVKTETLALARVKLKTEIADAEKRLALLDNTFKGLLGDHERGFAGAFEVTWAPRTRSGIDTKRLKAEHPDICAEYSKTTEYRAFDIKEA